MDNNILTAHTASCNGSVSLWYRAIIFSLKNTTHYSTILSAEDFFLTQGGFSFFQRHRQPTFLPTGGRRIFFFRLGRWILDAAPRT